MTVGFQIFSNVIAPVFTGMFFLLFFLYFVFSYPSRKPSYRLFILFLLGFSVFLFGRPLQLLLGPYPYPLIIVNLRVFILCSIVSPVIVLASDTLHDKPIDKRRALRIVGFYFLLGLTYCVFNTLGTKDSYPLFEWGGIIAYDNLTPSRQPPFYGREVTLGVQVITGLLLFFVSLRKLVNIRNESALEPLIRKKIIFLNVGILIFALSFIIGSLAKQWWVYYVTSIVIAFLFGCSVLLDIKEVHRSYERMIPFLKEEIFHTIAFSDFSKKKLLDLLKCLGKSPELETFIIFRIQREQSGLTYDFQLIDRAIQIIEDCLSMWLPVEGFLSLPLGDGKLGIALQAGKLQRSHSPSLLEILEEVQKVLIKKLACQATIGVGRSYGSIEDLHHSYFEAVNALEYAEQYYQSGIIHVENLREKDRRLHPYPVREKEKLLSMVKLGDAENARLALEEFLVKFKPFIEEKPDVLKIRLYDLVGSLNDAALLAGGDEQKLTVFLGNCLEEINFLEDYELLGKWLRKVVQEIVRIVGQVYEGRSKYIIENAKRYMEAHYQEPLRYMEVAKEVSLSPSHFLYLFKQETGMTFGDYLMKLRIDKAKELLLSTPLNITEIAFEVGFQNSNYFSAAFKKAVGVAASMYRKKLKQ